MKNANFVLSKRWRTVTILFFFFLIVIFVQDILREVVIFRQETDIIVEELDRDIHNEVQQNVENVVDDFNLVIENLVEDMEEHSHETLEGLYFSSEMILKLNPTATDSELKADLVETVKEYSLNDQEHVYYLYDINGMLLFDGVTGSKVPSNEITRTDDLNRLYIEEFVESFDANDDASVVYYLEEHNEVVQNVLYGKRIGDTPYIVANSINMNTYTQKSLDQLIEQINSKYNTIDPNVFIVSTDGYVLYHFSEALIGQNINTTTNPLVKKNMGDIIAYAEANDSGHMMYDFHSDFDDGEVEKKIAYVHHIKEWDLVVGSSTSSNKYADIIETYVSQNYRLVLFIKLPSYIIIAILSVIIYGYLQSTVKTSLLIVEEEEKLYRKFANLTSEIILITDMQGQIIFTNNLGRKTIYGQRENGIDVFFDQILVEEEGYFILYGYTDDFFVKYVTEDIVYNNQEAILYIINDVTDKIKTERKLEALSLVDELTKLGNRRMMVREYNDIVLPNVKQGSAAYLAMIDLDDFKPANDTYGHSYGDQVLKNVSSIFLENKDKDTLIYRVGGDEFAFILLNKTQEEVTELLVKIQKQVSEFDYGKPVDIGFSAGVSIIKVNDQKRRFSDYFDKADKLLYKSKKEGKNTINF